MSKIKQYGEDLMGEEGFDIYLDLTGGRSI